MIKTQQIPQQQMNQYSQQQQKKQWTIQDFELGPQLGKGKFSEVYICREKVSGFIVALKIMDKQFLKQYGLEEQIKREILLQKCMQQENILQLYGFFHDDKKIYLILEYSEQGDLYTLMHQYKDKKIPEELARFFIKQVINALLYLHSHNIIHRDLKPENLLISNGGIKLADFGLATKLQQQQENNTNYFQQQQSLQHPEKRKTFCGTLDYISPEMFMKQGHDNKIDIWSVGILIYELCAGKPPFESQTYEETKQKVVNCQNNIQYPSHFSKDLKNLLSQILIPQPEKRLTFQQIFAHKWMQQQQQNPNINNQSNSSNNNKGISLV